MTQALLIIDLQNDYFAGGKMELDGTEEAAANAGQILAHFRREKLPVFHIQHLSDYPGAAFFVPDTQGVEIHKSVQPLPDETLVQKRFPNGFRETSLEKSLRTAGVKSVVICGAMSHMCVDATTRAAFDLGFVCTLITDACATRQLEFSGKTIASNQVHGAFMAALGAVYAKLTTADEYLP